MRPPLVAGLGGAALAFAIVAAAVGIGGGEASPDSRGMAAPASGTATTASAAGADGGRAVFSAMGCGSCHTLAAAGSGGTFGPNLDERLPMHTRESLVARIMAPPGALEDFGGMPTNFRERLTEKQLDQLVDFLMAARREE